MPNFIKIGQTVFEMSRFLIFEDCGRRHLDFQKFSTFMGCQGPKGQDDAS